MMVLHPVLRSPGISTETPPILLSLFVPSCSLDETVFAVYGRDADIHSFLPGFKNPPCGTEVREKVLQQPRSALCCRLHL